MKTNLFYFIFYYKIIFQVQKFLHDISKQINPVGKDQTYIRIFKSYY